MDIFLEKLETLNNSLEKYRINKEKLLSTTINNNSNKNDIMNKLDNIINKMYEINDDIEHLQYNIDMGEINKSEEIINRIKYYELDNKMLNTFLPLMLIYYINNI